MANMSYCMFENTSRDFAQLISAMEEAGSREDLNLNQYEQPHWRDFPRDICRFLELWATLEGASDDSCNDGQLEDVAEMLEDIAIQMRMIA